MRTERIFVPFIGQSLNAYIGGDGRRYYGDKKRASKFAAYCWHHLEPFDGPVALLFQPHLRKGRRAFDVTNFVATTKILEDCMVQSGLLVDDTKRYVSALTIVAPVECEEGNEGMTIEIVENQHPMPLRAAQLPL